VGPNQEASLPEITLTPVDVLHAIIILQVTGDGGGGGECEMSAFYLGRQF
jgi:hypothetical protein